MVREEGKGRIPLANRITPPPAPLGLSRKSSGRQRTTGGQYGHTAWHPLIRTGRPAGSPW